MLGVKCSSIKHIMQKIILKYLVLLLCKEAVLVCIAILPWITIIMIKSTDGTQEFFQRGPKHEIFLTIQEYEMY